MILETHTKILCKTYIFALEQIRHWLLRSDQDLPWGLIVLEKLCSAKILPNYFRVKSLQYREHFHHQAARACQMPIES